MNATSLEFLRLQGKPAGAARSASTAEQHAPDPELSTDEDECLAFGYLRGIRDQAFSLELRFTNGESQAFPYQWLGPVRYHPSAGLLLTFVGNLVHLVLLEGANLNALVKNAVSLYDRGILRRRVTSWVREMTRHELSKAGQGEVTIERIRTLSHRPDEEPKGVEWLEAFKVQT